MVRDPINIVGLVDEVRSVFDTSFLVTRVKCLLFNSETLFSCRTMRERQIPVKLYQEINRLKWTEPDLKNEKVNKRIKENVYVLTNMMTKRLHADTVELWCVRDVLNGIV